MNNEEVFRVACCCVCKESEGKRQIFGHEKYVRSFEAMLPAPVSAHVSLFIQVKSGSDPDYHLG